MGRASRIASTARGVLRAVTGRWPEFSDPVRPYLDLDTSEDLPGYECIYDLAVAGEQVVVLFESDPFERLPDGEHGHALATTTLALSPITHRLVPQAIRRVAITRSRIVLATENEVLLDEHGTLQRGRVVDLASTLDAIAVVGESRVTFYDDVGRESDGIDVFAPTAVAPDPDGGWLVAADGGVYRLERGALRRIAPVAEPVRKVRRDRDVVYVLVANELRAIRGDHVEVLGEIDDNAWYWNDFDVGPEGLVVYREI